jgi:hypothetical protein
MMSWLITMLKSEMLLVWWNRRAKTQVTYGFRVHLMSRNSLSPMALHSRRPILGRLQSIYTLHNKLQSIYLLPSILDINYN